MALNSNFESWLEEKINGIKATGGLKYFKRRDSDENFNIERAPEEGGGEKVVNIGEVSGQNMANQFSSRSTEGQEEYNYKFATNTAPHNYYSITDIIDDDEDDDSFYADAELEVNTDVMKEARDLDHQNWEFTDNFVPEMPYLKESYGEPMQESLRLGQREPADGHSQPGKKVEGEEAVTMESLKVQDRNFEQPYVISNGNQHDTAHAQTTTSRQGPHVIGGAILPMDGLDDLSMDELASIDSGDMEDRSEMLEPYMDRTESIDLADDEHPIITVDQASLLEQWKRRAQKIRIAFFIFGIILTASIVGLVIYFIVHSH